MSGMYEDADCQIKNGYFLFYHANGVLESIGKYVHGKKEGTWLRYYNDGSMSDSTFYVKNIPTGTSLSWYSNGYPSDSTVIDEAGNGVKVTWFDNGKPSSAGRFAVGRNHAKWTYFHKNGKQSSIETYVYGRLTGKQYFDEDGNPLIDTTSRDRHVSFPGGTKGWDKYTFKNIYFPSQYKLINGDKAVVVVTFDIDEDGNIANVFVITPFYPEFDKIVTDAIKKSPKWLPAIEHNRRMTKQVRQTIFFTQKDE
jgi:hypothetical protein